ncbi:single-strand selective monofunctional uracil DNA glycosylase-like [Penaeus japonicus]|uniref:single-strand selective monofunctional uracil DNA glycosylase-like n=1 Tax=Penaeus japonicus TaxID=27405 RepID=UPI001C70BEB1|nr:single-strand selective monofunctional uracil DNA glycosylase-like [Penaeus japonicus]
MPPKSKRQKTQHPASNESDPTTVDSNTNTNNSTDSLVPVLSKYFPAPSSCPQDEIPQKFLEIEAKQTDKLLKLDYGAGISYVYNPLDYASEIHSDFVSKFCRGFKKVLLMGMNPGPWGMGQTGVPFGHVKYAKEWLGVTGKVKSPEREHPKRPIQGLECTRSEVSGDRLWSLMKELSGSPDVLFKHVFFHNYCPLFFLKESAKNVTPPELKVKERAGLEEACNEALVETVKLLQVEHIIGVGKYALEQARKALEKAGITNIELSLLMHPSPVNPAANKGWREIAIKQLTESKLIEYFKPEA